MKWSAPFRNIIIAALSILVMGCEPSFHDTYEKAKAGDPKAQTDLSYLYYDGEIVPKDYKKSFYWAAKAAKGGYAPAQYSIGYDYTWGKIVPENLSKAIYWLERAAAQNDIEAISMLGVLYRYGDGVEQDFEKSFALFQKAAKYGDIKAMGYLSEAYYFGYGTVIDYKKALYWAHRAAQKNNTTGLNVLGFHWEMKADENIRRMKRYIAQQNSTDLYVLLMAPKEPKRYAHKTDEYFARAAYYYKKSAELGNSFAQFSLAELYLKEDLKYYNIKKGETWMLKAAEQDHASAQNFLARLYNGDIPEYSCDLASKQKDACKNKILPNQEKYIYWLKRAAHNGHMYAQFNFAVSLYNKGNFSQAVSWYKKSADQGYSGALNNLGNMYYLGEGVEQDCKKAMLYYHKAIQSNGYNAVAAFNLGELYETGKCVKKDLKHAAKWYSKSLDWSEHLYPEDYKQGHISDSKLALERVNNIEDIHIENFLYDELFKT